ncbi:MAG TPA: hypothetical protein PK264_14875 [Hyphomicrobiaceae bacterium]|nr:hypothetical protein [Hyphomicrobiaceae bacterium]
MRSMLIAAAVIPALMASSQSALACTPPTVALIESLASLPEPPIPTKCGSDRNEFMRLAHLKDWKGALAAYERHLTSWFGRQEAGTADARATLDYLRRKAAGN